MFQLSPFVMNEPSRDVLVPYTKHQIMVGTLALRTSHCHSQSYTHTHTGFGLYSWVRQGLQSVFLPWCLRTFLAFTHIEWMSTPCLGWRAAVPNDWCAIIAIFVNTKHCHITTEIAIGKVSCSWHSAQSSHQECRCAQSMNEVAIKLNYITTEYPRFPKHARRTN